MKLNCYTRQAQVLLLLIFLFTGLNLQAQTPGKIVRDGQWQVPPNLPGSFLLDPNGDGFTSFSSTGFAGGCDIGPGCSEINYRFVPTIFGEILADLRRGPTGQYSEIVPDGNGRGMYVHFDGTNILGRLRIGSTMSGAKGYSILVDADGKFGATGPNADPNYSPQTTGTNGNPGYEFEIVLRSAFGVAVYFVNNSCNDAPLLIYENTTNTASIVSIAATNQSGDPDYFYDFHVPLSAMNYGGFNVTASTPLRIQTTTVMSPQGAICGPKSDIYGRDSDFGTPTDQYEETINGTCSFTLNDITITGAGFSNSVCTAPPVVNSGISATATSVSGTWTRASYSSATTTTITVYKNGTLAGTINNVASGSTWTLTGLSLTEGDLVTATAQSSGECICQGSNTVRVVACTPGNTSPCPVVTCASNKGIAGTGVPGATIRIYRLTTAGRTLVASGVLGTSGIWSFQGGSTTGNDNKVCGTGRTNDVAEGTYIVTQEVAGSCQTSTCTIINTENCVATATPVISQQVILSNTAAISGTTVSGAVVRLFINGNEVATQTASGVNYSFNLSAYYLNTGDIIEVSAQSGSLCSSVRVSRTVACFVAPPVITANEAGQVPAGSPISGISSEPAGTVVSIFNNATNALVGTATVVTGFTWTTSFNAVAGTVYYATQVTACGRSDISAIVTGTTQTPATRCGTITGPVNEGATTVSGTLTGAVANTTVRLLIDGALVGQTTTNGTTWSIPATQTLSNGVVVPLIFAGGVLTIEIAQSGQVGVVCPASVTVQCVAPSSSYSFSIDPTGSGTGISSSNPYVISSPAFSVTLTGTQEGILYSLEDETGTDQSPSLFANTSGTLVFANVATPSASGNFTWKIKATKLGACTETTKDLFLQKAACNTTCVPYRTRRNGLWSDLATWEMQDCNFNWVAATQIPSNTNNGVNILVRDVLTQDLDFTVNNCPITLANGQGELIILPNITLDFAGNANGSAFFNNRPVTIRSTSEGTGAIGEVRGSSTISDRDNVTLERFIPGSKRRWNLLTPGVTNGSVGPNTTLRDAWGGGNRGRITNSNNRGGSVVYPLGNPPGGKPKNIPHPIPGRSYEDVVNNPHESGYNPNVYMPYDGTIITGHRHSNGGIANSQGFDWWPELIIPAGEQFYITPTQIGTATNIRTTPSSIRPYRPTASTDFGPERGTQWVSNSTINSDPAKGGRSLVQLKLDELDNGYMIFTRGDRRVLENWFDSTTLRPTGKIRTGDIQVPVYASATQSITLVPNPYPSPISLEKLYTGTDNDNVITGKAHIWDSKMAGANGFGGWVTLTRLDVNTWIAAPSVAEGNPALISSSQAFLVEGTGTGGNLTFRENMKVDIKSVVYTPFDNENGSSSGSTGILLTNLNNRNSTTGELSVVDGVGILLDDKFTPAATDKNDVKKVFNFEGGKSISLVRDGNLLSFEAYPNPKAETVFPMQIGSFGQQGYAFTFTVREMEKDGREAWLRDKFLGTETPISLTSPTQYNFEGNADANSTRPDRFEIVFKSGEVLPVTFTSINAVEQGKNVKVTWNVATEEKMSHYEVEHSTNGTAFGKAVKVDAKNTSPANYEWLHVQPGNGTHFYRVRAFNLEGRSLLTRVVKVTLGDNQPGFKAFPTVVSATRQVTLQLISLDKGKYTLQVTDMAGRVISARTIEHNGGSASMILQMPPALSAGKYNIRLSGTSGSFVESVLKD